jgi:hypothetical protein
MSEGTFTAPDVGVVDTIDKALAGAAAAAVVDVDPAVPAAWFEPEFRKARVVPTAAMAMRTTTKETIHTGRRRLDDRDRMEWELMVGAAQAGVGSCCGSETLIALIDTDCFHRY